MSLLSKIIYKFKKSKKPYKLKNINPLKKAKAMDLIIELCMKYYIGDENKIDFYKVEEKLCDDLGFHSWESEFLLKIMVESKYIVEVFNNDNILERIYCSDKGIKKFIDGGFEPKVKRKIREGKLIRIGQWSSGIIGLYYLATFLKEYLETLCEILKYLIYMIGNFL